MGKKKRVKKELESQIQLASVFEGVFDSKLIASILKESQGDEEIALMVLTDMRNAMYEGCGTAGGAASTSGAGGRSSNDSASESYVDQIHSMFHTYDREVISIMLLECDNDVEKVIEIISRECDTSLLPSPPSFNDSVYPISATSPRDGVEVNHQIVNNQESTDNLQIIKYILTDFMSSDQIENYLQEKQCTENASVEYLQGIIHDLLDFVSMSTTSDDINDSDFIPDIKPDVTTRNIFLNEDLSKQSSLNVTVSEACDVREESSFQQSPLNPSFNLDGEFEMNIFLFESDAQNGANPFLSFQDEWSELQDAKQIVRSFFENTSLADIGVSYVSDAMIETALEISKAGPNSYRVSTYDPDAAIGWLCEEITNNSAQREKKKLSPKSRLVMNSTKQTPMTYASKVSVAPEEENRAVACCFGGDSEKTPDSSSSHTSASRQLQSVHRIDVDAVPLAPSSGHHAYLLEGGNTSTGSLATYWRHVHEENKKHMLRSFSAASCTRSRDSVANAQRFKHSMYHAAAESAKYALLSRNPHILVENSSSSGHFVQFKGFVKSTPKKMISIDMHGVDVRSAVQFVKSLIDTCCGAGHYKNFSLIVGVGNHSIGNIPRLKPALLKYLQSNIMVKLLGGLEGTIDFSLGR